MKGFLNKSELDYVIFHLGNHIELSADLLSNFEFIRSIEETKRFNRRILFLQSDKELNTDHISHFDKVPVLFPVLNELPPFRMDAQDNLVFTSDLFKSAFYLLSGYQEFANPDSKDNLKRFAFEDSIQYKLDFTSKPVVNYYFEWIVQGIELFCKKREFPVTRKRLFSNFGFVLSHDIDKIDYYDFNYLVYKLKEILKLRKSRLSLANNIKVFVKGTLSWLNLTKEENPYWNFDFLVNVEKQRKLKSVFFFLDRGVKHSDAYYSFNEERVIKLFTWLQQQGCEIGLHGTVESIFSEKVMNSSMAKLKNASHATVEGIRQHRLLWNHPHTAIIQQNAGLKYDSTLGFAAHEGFRNSYCYPFKLYDFETNRTIDIWEFPLNVMDGTLFAYKEYNPSQAMEKCNALIAEILKFGGVFSVLWHNSFFDDLTYPGVTQFYLDLLQNITERTSENILGSELLARIETYSAN